MGRLIIIKASVGKYAAAIYRNAQTILSYKLEGLDLKKGEYDFFYYISQNEGTSQQELSDNLYIGKSTTAKAVKNLIKYGYISREQDRNDRRCKRLFLTEKGKRIAPLIKATFRELIDIYCQDISETEYEETIKVLTRVLANVYSEKDKLRGRNCVERTRS